MNQKKDYNFNEAIWKFALLKTLEISAVLIFIFGFYYLGLFVNNHQGATFGWVGGNIPLPHSIDNPSVFDVWIIGVYYALILFLILIVWWAAIIVCFLIVLYIGHINWEWSKRWAETKEGRTNRLTKKEEELRERWELLEGDLVTIKKDLVVGKSYESSTWGDSIKFVAGMKKYMGKTARILELDVDGSSHSYRISVDGKRFWWTTPMLTLKKKREIDSEIANQYK
jgi:uncharacterized membrane protein